MSVVSIGTLRYDIVSDTTSFVRGMKATRAQMREADALFRRHRSPIQGVQHEMERLTALRQKEMISARVYREEMKRLGLEMKKLRHEREENLRVKARHRAIDRMLPPLLARQAKAILGVAQSWNTAAASATRYRGAAVGATNRGAAGANMANIGGSLGSAMGFGGAGAGMGRLAGLGGMGGLSLVAGVGVAKAIREFAELETAMVDLQVIMGDDAAGEKFVNTLRKIARETPLTAKQLIKNAQTLLSYGMSQDGMTDTLTRLGEIAGGDTARFEALTRAYAQVQSAGKLMGQERLQLINAGYDLTAIADAAGIEMADFNSEMEKGNISARHLTESMINLTSEGGKFHGRLGRQAETLAGTWSRVTGEMEQDFAGLGEEIQASAYTGIAALKGLSDAFIQTAKGMDTIFTSIFGEGSGGPGSSQGKSWWMRGIDSVKEGILTSSDWTQNLGLEDALGFWGGSEGRAEYEANQKRFANIEKVNKAKVEAREQEEAAEQARLRALDQEADRWAKSQESQIQALREKEQEKLTLRERQQIEIDKFYDDSLEWTAKKTLEMRAMLAEKHKMQRKAERAEIKEEEKKARAEKLEAERKALRNMFDEANKWEAKRLKDAEQANKEALKKIEEDRKKTIDDYGKANKPSASFEAGSVEEYQFRSEMALAARKDAYVKSVNDQAAADRKAQVEQLKKLNKKIKSEADFERKAVQDTLGVLK